MDVARTTTVIAQCETRRWEQADMRLHKSRRCTVGEITFIDRTIEAELYPSTQCNEDWFGRRGKLRLDNDPKPVTSCEVKQRGRKKENITLTCSSCATYYTSLTLLSYISHIEPMQCHMSSCQRLYSLYKSTCQCCSSLSDTPQ